MFGLFGLAFGIHLSMPAWMLIMVAANMISSLPITPSNIGAFEVAITELTEGARRGRGHGGRIRDRARTSSTSPGSRVRASSRCGRWG